MVSAFQSTIAVAAFSALVSFLPLTTSYAAATKDKILSEKKLTAGIHGGKPWGYRTPDGPTCSRFCSGAMYSILPISLTSGAE